MRRSFVGSFAALAVLATPVAGVAVAQCDPSWIPVAAPPFSEILDSTTWQPLSGPPVMVFGGTRTTGAGTNLHTFNPGLNTWAAFSGFVLGPQNTVTSLVVLPNGDLLVSGLFVNSLTLGNNIVNTPYLARYVRSSPSWVPVGNRSPAGGLNGPANKMVVLPGGAEVLIAGAFTQADGIAASQLARFIRATNTLTAAGTTPAAPAGGVDGSVYDAVVLTAGPLAGSVVLVGDFDTAVNSTVASPAIALYTPGGTDGAISAFPGLTTADTGWSVAQLPGGDLLVGTADALRRYSFATNSWSVVAAQSLPIRHINVLPSGDAILAGGTDGAARFRAATNSVVPVVGGLVPRAPGAIWTSIVGSNGVEYFGGAISAALGAGGGPAENFAAAFAVGVPSTFTAPPVSVRSCPARAGVFTATVAAGTPPVTYQWQWRPVGGVDWQNVIEGRNALDSDPGNVLFGAYDPTTLNLTIFNAVATNPPSGATTLELRLVVTTSGGCPPLASAPVTWTVCPADVDCSGIVSVNDLFTFLELFFANCP